MQNRLMHGKTPFLKHKIMACYGLPHLTHSIVILPMVLFIPSYYAEQHALPLASVGIAIAFSRLLDVITDPLIGALSDRYPTRWGRRKPWLILGAPLLMLATWMVFVPVGKVSVSYLLIWTSLLFLAFTIFDLPYKAWGAELSSEYHERSRVAAWRAGFGAIGHIMFLSVLFIMSIMGDQNNADQLRTIALMVCISLPVLVTIAILKVPEFPPEKLKCQTQSGWTGMMLLFHNKAFVRTIMAIVLFGSGLIIQATLHKLVITHVVGRPELFTAMILAETIASLAAVPLWMRLSHRIGKHRALTLAALWIGTWSLALPMVGKGDIGLYMSLIIMRGSSLASIVFLSNSIAADVLDQDILEVGQQRTGLFFSIWGMAMKMAIGLGVLLGTSLPAMYGFDPSSINHNAATESALMVIYGWLPCLIMVFAFPLLWNFPINQSRQQQLRRQINTLRCK